MWGFISYTLKSKFLFCAFLPLFTITTIIMQSNVENFSTNIINTGVQKDGPYSDSPNFSVKVQRGLPDFFTSVNLQYVKLGYHILISHGLYIVIAPFLALIGCAQLGKLVWDDSDLHLEFSSVLLILGLLCLIAYIYVDFLHPRPTYLVDFACYSPPKELKVNDVVNLTLSFLC